MRKVIVNFSGGKDSTVAILEALKRYPKEDIPLLHGPRGNIDKFLRLVGRLPP